VDKCQSESWDRNPNATKRVKDLLTKAGLPLEIRTANACRSFSSGIKAQGIMSDSERLVYGNVAEGETLREIDQVVSLYSEMDVGPPIGVQLLLQILIECKHRDDMELFAFPEHSSAGTLRVPIITDLAGSDFAQLLARDAPAFFEGRSQCAFSLLKIEEGTTPKDTLNENLIYKASASLYDFITAESRALLPHVQGVSQTVEELDLLERFDSLALLTDEAVAEFNARRSPDKSVYTLITIDVPVVCTDAPIHLVKTDRQGNIQEFTNVDSAICSMRVPNWPGGAENVLVTGYPETAVTVVTHRGLKQCLRNIYRWYKQVATVITQSPQDVRQRAWCQAEFRQALLSSRSAGETTIYRSDLGFV
jgi:hypothetical protein